MSYGVVARRASRLATGRGQSSPKVEQSRRAGSGGS